MTPGHSASFLTTTARLPHMVLLGILLATAPGSLTLAEDAAPSPARSPAQISDALGSLVFERAERVALARNDGFVYSIDVALLMLSAVLEGSRPRYERMVGLLRSHFLVDSPPDFAGAVAAWRARIPSDGKPLDASGTTEALHLAEALYAGAEAFGRRADEMLAGKLLKGYALHAANDNGVWIVRNYYNLQTRTFATNSYTIDYAPDLLTYAATRLRNDRLRDISERSVALLQKTRRPNGLVDAIIQPELITLYPDVVFSPDDVIIVEHACIVAEHAARAMPALARELMAFIMARADKLHRAYGGQSGHPAGKKPADVGTFSGAVRLAARLGDRGALAKLRKPLLDHAGWLVDHPAQLEIHAAGQALLALHLLKRAETGASLPAVMGRPDRSGSGSVSQETAPRRR